MEKKDLEKFDPTVAELTAMVQATKDINATDLKDKAQLEIVRTSRISLKNARVKITKIGKELRADAVKFQNDVIAKEKELIGIIEPEEDRLALIEEQAKELAIREERIEKLPARKQRLLDLLGGWIDTPETDEELLAMDSIQFETFYNEKVSKHNEDIRLENERLQKEEQERIEAEQKAEQDRIKAEQKEAQDKIDAERKALDDDRAKVDAEKAEIARQKEIKEAEDKARAEEKARIEQEAKEKAEAEKAEADRIAKEKKEEEAKLAKRKKFIEYRASLGWTEETKADWKMEETEEGYVFYKKVGIFNK